MSCNLTIDMTCYTHSNIIFYLEQYLVNGEHKLTDIYEIVHLVEFLEEAKEESFAKDNKDAQRWWEHEKLFRDDEYKMVQPFLKVQSVIDDNVDRGLLEQMGQQDEFHLIHEIVEKLEEYYEGQDNKQEH